MAKAPLKAGDLPEDTLIIDAADLDISEAEIETDNILNNLLADLGDSDDIKITVYRVKQGNEMTWVKSFGPTEMDMEALLTGLRDQYGGGKYKIQVRQKGAIRKAKMIEIEPPPETPEFDQAAAIRDLKAEQQTESMGGMAAMFAQMMKANQDQLQHQADSQQRFMEMVVTAITGNSQQQQIDPVASMAGVIESVAALHKLAAPVAAPDATEMILKGVELVSAIRGDGDGEANIYTVLSKAMGSFGDTLQQAMSTAQTPGQILPTGQPVTPTQPTEAEAPRLTAEKKPGEQETEKPDNVSRGTQLTAQPQAADSRLAGFEPYVDYLIYQASRQGNPDLYAEVTIDSIGAEMAHAWLATEEGISKLAANFPKMVEHTAWFIEVGRAVDEQLREEENQDGSGSHQDGDVSTGRDNQPVSTTSNSDQASVDGTAERIGRNQDDADDNVETGE